MPHKVVIIDYGVGNVTSVSQALSFLGYSNVVSGAVATIRQGDAYVLPGVGAFSEAAMNLRKHEVVEALGEEVLVRKKPLLGICLGMQVLGSKSDESPGYPGLGWIDFDVVEIPQGDDIKVPHVGWNTVAVQAASYLFNKLEEEPHFYFDHRYYARCPDAYVAALCDYGSPFPAALSRENIVGVQFHPEKSQNNGLKLFRNFFNHFGVRPC